MPDLFSVLLLNAVVPSNSSATAQYIVPRGDAWDIYGVYQQATSQSCSITDIRDSRGYHYTNASPNTPLPLGLFQQAGSPNISLNMFSTPLHLDGDTVFYIDLKDSSGAQNTVNIMFIGKRSTGSTA